VTFKASGRSMRGRCGEKKGGLASGCGGKRKRELTFWSVLQEREKKKSRLFAA